MSAQAAAVDLSAAPFRPSRILSQFVHAREAERTAKRQADERAAAARQGPALRIPRGAFGSAQSDAAQPAFPVVSGQRAFGAAGTDRLAAGWSVTNSGINADLEAALDALRARSRDWAMNTDSGERFVSLCVDNVVGAEAPRLQMRAKLADGRMDEAANQAVEDAWAQWCRSAGVDGLSWHDVCRLGLEAAARDGEALGRHVIDNALPFGYAIQLLDVDRIDTRRNVGAVQRGAPSVRLGVEVNALSRPLALYLTDGHPGDPRSPAAGRAERVPVEHLVHAFVRRRPEQVRGYPWAAAVLKRSNMLDGFEQYAMVAAKWGAAQMGFYTVDKDTVSSELTWDQVKDATGNLAREFDAGLLEALPPGVDFKANDSKYPTQAYGPFVDDARRSLAAGLNVAHHNLSGNMRGVNYSSARIAELTERRHWRALQRWFVRTFIQPVFEAWLRAALLTGSIRLPSGAALPPERAGKFAAAATFTPPSWPWVAPDDDMKADAIALTYDRRSLRQLNDEAGVDLDEVLLEKARLRDRYIALDLPVPPWLTGGAPLMATGGAAPAAGKPAANDDQADDQADEADDTEGEPAEAEETDA